MITFQWNKIKILFAKIIYSAKISFDWFTNTFWSIFKFKEIKCFECISLFINKSRNEILTRIIFKTCNKEVFLWICCCFWCCSYEAKWPAAFLVWIMEINNYQTKFRVNTRDNVSNFGFRVLVFWPLKLVHLSVNVKYSVV